MRAIEGRCGRVLDQAFVDEDLLDGIERALARSREIREREAEMSGLRQRYDALTKRERQSSSS